MIDCQIIQTLAEISSTRSSAKRLSLVSWNGNPAKLDLRTWRTDEDPEKPGRGVTLSDEEAQALFDALKEYFAGSGGAED